MGVWIETWVFPDILESGWSHPAWVCGLKLTNGKTSSLHGRSHPAWVCGLKHSVVLYNQRLLLVTPCVGVWIETLQTFSGASSGKVTPCVGVWIETLTLAELVKSKAPSHPAWVCGLKPNESEGNLFAVKSHPAWVCGLKQSVTVDCFTPQIVTPCVGVWIETSN